MIMLSPIRSVTCLHPFTKDGKIFSSRPLQAPAILPRRLPKIFCGQKEYEKDSFQGFSALSSDVPWENGSLWSTMGAYFFGLHVPLSFGGLSMVAHLLHQPTLGPLTEAVSLALIQTVELLCTLALLSYTRRNHQFKLSDLFFGKDVQGRNWIKAAAVGLSCLITLVLFSSLLADLVIGPQDVTDPIVKEILSSGLTAKLACILVYCFITPLLEETVYRGFLLTSLASVMEWRQAIGISAFIFSAAHLSIENSLQLFCIGCILGSTYCWSGKLSSSFAVHALYNALILLATMLS